MKGVFWLTGMAVQLEKPMPVCNYLALDNEPPGVTG